MTLTVGRSKVFSLTETGEKQPLLMLGPVPLVSPGGTPAGRPAAPSHGPVRVSSALTERSWSRNRAGHCRQRARMGPRTGAELLLAKLESLSHGKYTS